MTMTFDHLVVLYVEDEIRSRKVMRMAASDMGIETLVMFEDSVDFLARAEALQPRPDLVFLDIHVQPYSGFEMLRLLRESPQFDGVPVVAMTASVMNEEIAQLRSAGFDSCLAKPIDLDYFPALVQQILDGESVWRITH